MYFIHFQTSFVGKNVCKPKEIMLKNIIFRYLVQLCHIQPRYIRYLACCIIFYDSAQRYKQFHPLHKVTGTTKICMIELMIVLLNYYCVFRS